MSNRSKCSRHIKGKYYEDYCSNNVFKSLVHVDLRSEGVFTTENANIRICSSFIKADLGYKMYPIPKIHQDTLCIPFSATYPFQLSKNKFNSLKVHKKCFVVDMLPKYKCVR